MGFLVWFILALAATTLLSTCTLALSEDGKTLLEIKGAFNDSRSFLKNWRASDFNPCNWTGISCHPDDQRVSSINLPYMQLGGILSPSISKLSRLRRLALHQNSLHGSIPTEIVNCTELRALYLRANYLQGSIPPELGNLSHLTILDLSSNSLKGSIPSSIGHLTHLRFLNLSTNFFSGEIPNFGVLGTFGKKSFIGNLDLCGKQVKKPCLSSLGFPAVLPNADTDEPPAAVPTKRFPHFLNGILIGAMSAMGLALVLLLAFLWICLLSKKERVAKKYTEVNKQTDQDSGTKLITFHGDLPYSSCELIEKLESLGEEDVLGSGGFGTVYKMVMNDGSIFAVKRIDHRREGSDKIFERELEILGSIKHINLVNLCGYCRLPTVKLLKLPTVYKMVVNDGGIFSVKRINRSREGSDKIFERELEILGSIKHINLVSLRGYCRLPTAKLLIYDYVTLGSLGTSFMARKATSELECSVKNCSWFCLRTGIFTP